MIKLIKWEVFESVYNITSAKKVRTYGNKTNGNVACVIKFNI